MNIHKTSVIIGIVTAGLLSFQASAATVSYLMDQSNTLEDDHNYLKVTLSDSLTMVGALDVRVETLALLDASPNADYASINANFASANANFGIQAFSFNAYPALLVSASADGFDITTQTMSLTNLPTGWTVATNKNMSSFGKFDIKLAGTGSTRMDTLTFTLGGVSLDTVDTDFAAHVAGFGNSGEVGAFFGGGTPLPVVASVPLPTAVWLFASGLVGLVSIARRRSTTAS